MPADGKGGDRKERFADLVPEVTPLGERDDRRRRPAAPTGAPTPPRSAHAAPGAGFSVLPPYSEGDRDIAISGRIRLLDAHSKPGMSRDEIAGLKRSEPDDEIILRGMRVRDAHAALEGFLRRALDEDLRVVDVCHGIGHGSQGGLSPIRVLSRHWMSESRFVLGFVTPPRNDGVARVRLRKKERVRR